MKIDARKFGRTLLAYMDWNEMDLDKALQKRSIGVAVQAIRIYKENAPSPESITRKVRNLRLDYRVKLRPGVRVRAEDLDKKIDMELRLRISARYWTSMGWLIAGNSLGARGQALINRMKSNQGGPEAKGSSSSHLTGWRQYIELNNDQPAADYMDRGYGGLVQQALDADADDMIKFMSEGLNRATIRYNRS